MGIAAARPRPKPEWGKRIGRFYNASSRLTHVTLASRAISTSHFQPDLAFPTSRDTHRHLGNLAAGNLGANGNRLASDAEVTLHSFHLEQRSRGHWSRVCIPGSG